MREEPTFVVEIYRMRCGGTVFYGWISKRMSTVGEYIRENEEAWITDHRHIFQSILGKCHNDLGNQRLRTTIRSVEAAEIDNTWTNTDESVQKSPINDFVMDEVQDNYDAFRRAEKSKLVAPTAAGLSANSADKLPIADFGEPGNADIPRFADK
jgi:hypothetical protein